MTRAGAGGPRAAIFFWEGIPRLSAAMVDWSGLDYTSMWAGIYAPPDSGETGSLYILDSERTVGKDTPIYDDCTRLLFDEAHPRTHPAGQRAPGPYGAGWALDRIGPDMADRRWAEAERQGAEEAEFRDRYFDAREAAPLDAPPPSPAARRAMRWYGGGGESRPETFAGGPSPEERRRYAQGSRTLGRPGPRGMVTSYRGERQAVDGVDWDPRPYRYAPESPNAWAHLSIPPAAQGPPLYSDAPASYLGPPPQVPQVDRFQEPSGPAPPDLWPQGPPPWETDPLYLYKAAFVFIAVILLATWAIVSSSQRALERRLDAIEADHARLGLSAPPAPLAPPVAD